MVWHLYMPISITRSWFQSFLFWFILRYTLIFVFVFHTFTVVGLNTTQGEGWVACSNVHNCTGKYKITIEYKSSIEVDKVNDVLLNVIYNLLTLLTL